MQQSQKQARRRARNPRRTFSVREQLEGKMGPARLAALEGRLDKAAALSRPKRRRRRRAQ